MTLARTFSFPSLLFAGLICCISLPASASVTTQIRDIYDSLLTGEDPDTLPVAIIADPVVTLFYERREFKPAWKNRKEARAVIELLGSSDKEGLNPADYHYPVLLGLIESYQKQVRKSDRTQAQFDVLLTDGLLLYARHLIEGKVDPRKLVSTWNYTRQKFVAEQVVADVSAAIAEGRVASTLEALKPQSNFYNQLRTSLQHYRQLAAKGSFYRVPSDKVLRKGDNHANVLPLRKQLSVMGLLPASATTSASFDEQLEAAVIQFQEIHAIDADGVVGAQSFTDLNTSWEQRVDQLRINLDRVRWIWEDVSDDYLVVNIPGYEVYYMRDQHLVWSSDVMTGTVRTQTPMFRSRMKYLEFNPIWTVPRSIIRRSLYGKFKKDPSYIDKLGYHLYDSAGARVDAAKMDWSQTSAAKFPYRVVQQPGPDNALGRVKFIFPNQYAIYLHDTPSRQLFERSARAFSAGCIRVEDPLELARLLLDDNAKWDASAVQSAVDSAERQQVRMPREIDVLLMYWTAGPTQGERAKLHRDVYNRDPDTLKALNQPPTWRDS